MPTYDTNHLKNIVLLGHAGCGKTTMAESMLFEAGVFCPYDQVGAVMGDLQTRISIVEGMEADGHLQKIIARVPLSQMQQYSSLHRSLTQG